MIKIVRAKLHGIAVTGCDLHYHGSITLDPEICHQARIYPLEFVEIWNKHSGQRISTYVIYGEAGSRCCVLNGAAARTCQLGDELVICASEYVASAADIVHARPQVLIFGQNNTLVDNMQYEVGMHDTAFTFAITKGDNAGV